MIMVDIGNAMHAGMTGLNPCLDTDSTRQKEKQVNAVKGKELEANRLAEHTTDVDMACYNAKPCQSTSDPTAVCRDRQQNIYTVHG